jgi:hypothetical protein
MSADTERLLPPNEPAAFESLCLDLWKNIWGDPGAQKNGRIGQPQAGVDVYGKKAGKWVGVQCKQKNGLLRTKLRAKELKTEVEAAKQFRPPLSCFIRDEERGQLYAYVTGILKNQDSPLIEMNIRPRPHPHPLRAIQEPRAREDRRAGEEFVIRLDQGATFLVRRFCVANRLRRVQRQPDARRGSAEIHPQSSGAPQTRGFPNRVPSVLREERQAIG